MKKPPTPAVTVNRHRAAGGKLSKKKQTQMMHTKKIEKSGRRKYVFKFFI